MLLFRNFIVEQFFFLVKSEDVAENALKVLNEISEFDSARKGRNCYSETIAYNPRCNPFIEKEIEFMLYFMKSKIM